MSLVGTLLFCTDCGNLLNREPSSVKTITCHVCAKVNRNLWPNSTKTVSKPEAFPSSLRQKHDAVIQTIDWETFESWPTTSLACPQCENHEVCYREVQMRSADEGSTVFYRCPRCGYTFKSDS